MNILLAEPNPILREELYKVFRKRGWRVTTSHDAAAVLNLLLSTKFDALVANPSLIPAASPTLPPKLLALSDSPVAGASFVLPATGDGFQTAKQAAAWLAKH